MTSQSLEVQHPTRDEVGTALPAWGSVLVVVAHPDDESFGLGAVLDGFIMEGAEVSVLCLTHGGASTLGAGPQLSQVRAKELRSAADQLGVESAVLLGYRDGMLSDVLRDILSAEVLRELDDRPTDGLVVFDPSGITGHADHTAATRAAVDAAAVMDLPVLAWTLPQDVADTLNEEFDAGFVGHEQSDVDLVVPVRRERQRSACLCHTSQAVPGSALWRRLELLGNHEHLRWLRREGDPLLR
ncbi:PIG-L family deacetylase [Tessaracoccus antarcticus]|uniref:PIG-L family deacetylase n=1 Tax=Tessaracoccus antarcticus TaxID=2479848 RepID=UPI0018F4C567|nr:PIG-L deacetylase family protein [Tessaracoccus antarcticus]